MSAAEWCDHVLVRLEARVRQEAPAGIGAWEPVWRMVEAPSRALFEAIAEVRAGRGDPDEVVRRGVAVREAWRTAGDAWQARSDARG